MGNLQSAPTVDSLLTPHPLTVLGDEEAAVGGHGRLTFCKGVSEATEHLAVVS